MNIPEIKMGRALKYADHLNVNGEKKVLCCSVSLFTFELHMLMVCKSVFSTDLH